jgi:hypothetical protein
LWVLIFRESQPSDFIGSSRFLIFCRLLDLTDGPLPTAGEWTAGTCHARVIPSFRLGSLCHHRANFVHALGLVLSFRRPVRRPKWQAPNVTSPRNRRGGPRILYRSRRTPMVSGPASQLTFRALTASTDRVPTPLRRREILPTKLLITRYLVGHFRFTSWPLEENSDVSAPKKLLTDAKVGYNLILAVHRGQVVLCNRMCPLAISSIKVRASGSIDVLVARGCTGNGESGSFGS